MSNVMSRISHLYESYLEIYEKNISFEVGGRRTTGLRNMTKKDAERHSPKAAEKHKEERGKVGLPKLNKESLEEDMTPYEQFYDFLTESLIENNFCNSFESAEVIVENMSDSWVSNIFEEYLEEKARGKKKKGGTVHAYDVDETLFSHGKKGKPSVKVHVKDEKGKRVKSLSNQEFNTHKLEKGHKYDFGEFKSSDKFKQTSSPNKKVIKDIKRKIKRGKNVHLVTARSKFDDTDKFHGHLKKHGINVDKKNIHYTGGMKGSDVGEKKAKIVNAIAKKSGSKKAAMYDDAAKVHKGFKKAQKDKPTSMKYKTKMVAPDKKTGESKVRPYRAGDK